MRRNWILGWIKLPEKLADIKTPPIGLVGGVIFLCYEWK